MQAEVEGHDVHLYSVGTELGPGCFEITLGRAAGLKAADDASFFRMAAHPLNAIRQRGVVARPDAKGHMRRVGNFGGCRPLANH